MKRRHTRRFRLSRDADAPRVGEIFESKNGTRWEVVAVKDHLVDVKRAGHRGGGSQYRWGKGVLKTMKGKSVKFEDARKEAVAEVPTERPTILHSMLFGGSTPPVAPDPSGRRKGKKGKKGKRPKKNPSLSAKRHRGAKFKRCKKPTHVQSLVFSRGRWTLARARAWAKAHGYKVTKVDMTEKSYRFRQTSPLRVRVVGQKPFLPLKGLTAVIACYK